MAKMITRNQEGERQAPEAFAFTQAASMGAPRSRGPGRAVIFPRAALPLSAEAGIWIAARAALLRTEKTE